MLSRFPRLGGGAGGAFWFEEAALRSCREVLVRDALEGVRFTALPAFDTFRRGGGGGTVELGVGAETSRGSSAAGTVSGAVGLDLREGGGGGPAGLECGAAGFD